MRPAYINKAIDYIEENLTGQLDVASLAGACFVSPAQMYRDFYSETGHSVKEYIRKRRLSRALALVKTSDMSLSATAAGCGYSSQQAFCKSVKAALGMTPLEYRDSGRVYFFPRYSYTAIYPVTVSTETLPELIRLDFYHPHLRGIESRAVDALTAALPSYGGRVFGRNGPQKGALFCYELYIEQGDNNPDMLTARGFAGFVQVNVAGGLYAKTIARNNDAAIERAWAYLYTDWLKASMFEQTDAPYFEEYIRRDGKITRLRLFLPVRKREGYDKITLQKHGGMLFLVSRAAGVNAEERAAGAVINFLSHNYPFLMKAARHFYVARNGGAYTCGVRIRDRLPVPEGGALLYLRIEGGEYAVLEGDCTGSSAALEAVLRAWVCETGFSGAGEPFSVYETDGGFRAGNIRTRVFIKMRSYTARGSAET